MKSDEQVDTMSEWLRDVQTGGEKTIAFIQKTLEESGGKELRVVMEERRSVPEREESQPRAHVFYEIRGFIGYLAKNKPDKCVSGRTIALVDIKAQSCVAVLDEGSSTGVEKITFVPQLHPVFAPWAALLAQGAGELEEFVSFLMANRRAITKPDGKELVLLLSQVRASEKVTIRRGFGKTAVNGVMCELDIQGEKKNQPVDIPEVITVECPLFVGTDPVTFEIDLQLGMGGPNHSVLVDVSSSDLEVKRLAAFEEMVEKLRKVEDVLVAMGKVEHARWEYIV
jgi:hypothetical protein